MNSIISPGQNKSFHKSISRGDFSKDPPGDPAAKSDDTFLAPITKLENGFSAGSLDPIRISNIIKPVVSNSASEASSSSETILPLTRPKTRPTIILTPSPTSNQNNPSAKDAIERPSPVNPNTMNRDSKKPSAAEESAGYPDLVYNNKTYRFFDWKIVAKLCWVAPFTQPPEGIFYHAEEDYFLYFGKSKTTSNQGTKHPEAIRQPQRPLETSETKESKRMIEEEEDGLSDMQEKSTGGSELEAKVKSEEKLSELLNNLQHSYSHRIIGENAGSLTVKPSQEVLDLLKKQVEERARSQMKGRDDGVSLSCVRSNFTKNLPKKIGDQFADYLQEHYRMNISKIFKDKMSWKVLNSYLEGQKVLEEGKIDTKALIQAFIDFIVKYEMKNIDASRTRDDVSKSCYKVTILSLKAAFEKLSTYVNLKQISSLSIAKSWPLLDIHYSVVAEQGSKK